MDNRDDLSRRIPLPKDAINKDYYKELGVPPSASKAEIDRAFRKLSLLHHPDRAEKQNRDRDEAQEKFKLITAAHDILTDENYRRQYDDLRKETSSSLREEKKKEEFKPQPAQSFPQESKKPQFFSSAEPKGMVPRKSRERKGDERSFYVVMNYVSMPKEFLAEAKKIYDAQWNKKEGEKKAKPIIEKSYEDISKNDTLKKELSHLFYSIPEYLTIFSNEEDAIKFKQSEGSTLIGMKETIQCFGVVKILMSPQDLQKADYVYNVHGSHSDRVRTDNFEFSQPVYVMTDDGYINFNIEEDLQKVKLLSEIGSKPLVNVTYPANQFQLPQLTASEIKTEAELIQYFKSKLNENLQESDKKFVNQRVQPGTLGHFIGNALHLKAMKNVDSYLPTLRNLANKNYKSFEECITQIEPVINKVIPVGTGELSKNLHSLVDEVKKIKNNIQPSSIPSLTNK